VTTSAKEKAAAKVLACMNTSANQVALAKAAGYVPSLQSAADQVAKDTPALAPFVAEVSTALSRTSVVGTKYPAIATALETAMQSALTGAASPQQALTTAQSSATKG
jgi:multiple sugar transport system substrate-binding protein